MNRRVRLLLTVGIPVLVIALVVGIFFWRTSAPTGTAPSAPGLTKMTLALDWTPNTNHTGIYVAKQKGWYREQGLDLQILPYSSSVSPDTLISTGKADVGISSTESIVADKATNQPVVSIAAILQHNTSALVALADSGITRPRDLDGKTYGGFGSPYEEAVVSAIIKKDGGKGNFKNVTLDVGAMDALKARRIDFVWIFMGVEGVQAEQEGIKLNAFSITQYGIPDYYTPNIITGPTQIKEKPDLLRKFMQATSKGYEFARSNAQESARLLMESNDKSVFPDAQYVEASQTYNSQRYADAGRKWGLQDEAAWQGYPNFMLENKAITDTNGKVLTEMNFNDLYTNQFLE